MGKFKVLHVGDVANVASNLVAGQKSLGIEAEIFPISLLSPTSNKLDLVILPFKKLGDAVRLKRYVRENGFNIIHVHFATQAWIALAAGLPYYLHVHGSDARRFLYTPGFGHLIRIAIQKAIKVFYVTPELKQHLEGIRSDAIFLPNPINLDYFKPQQDMNHSNTRVLCISKMDRYKGLEEIFQAVELILAAWPEVSVGMFGFGNMLQDAQHFFARHKDDPQITILSRLPYEQMTHLINSYDVVLGHQSPEYGSLSCSELEAMACEKPVVVHFSHPEAYPESPPVLVSQSAEDACANVIKLLEEPRLIRSLGQLARGWVGKYHERQYISQILLDHYRGS